LFGDTKILSIGIVQLDRKLTNFICDLWSQFEVLVTIVADCEYSSCWDVKWSAWQNDFTSIKVDLGICSLSSEFYHKVCFRAIAVEVERNLANILDWFERIEGNSYGRMSTRLKTTLGGIHLENLAIIEFIAIDAPVDGIVVWV
jgi:hypothetical protein